VNAIKRLKKQNNPEINRKRRIKEVGGKGNSLR